MFQFSSLLSKSDTEPTRSAPNANIAQTSAKHTADSTADTGGSADCITERVRRDLNEQMERLAQLLDRVESFDFDREAADSEIFRNAPAPDESAVRFPIEITGEHDEFIESRLDPLKCKFESDGSASLRASTFNPATCDGDALLDNVSLLPQTAGVHVLVVENQPGPGESPPQVTTTSPQFLVHPLQLEMPRRIRRETVPTGPADMPDRAAVRSDAVDAPWISPRVVNILAVIGSLLALATIAYVASDLASWFSTNP